MRISNITEVQEELNSHLEEYLQDQGIDTKNKFTCFTDHQDHNPSMSLNTDGKTVKCFGCNFTGGIFHAAHWLENKSLNGGGFIDTVAYLANKFGIELNYESATEEEKYKARTFTAYQFAAQAITSGEHSVQFDSAIEQRGWTRDICNHFGVGSIKSSEQFHQGLQRFGFDDTFLDETDLQRPDIFGPDRLIFTIQDDRGRPVGFAARNLNYTKDKSNGPKYVNQRGSGTKVNIYQKGKRLFGFAQYLQKNRNKSAPLYIFEGYADVVTAALHGVWNVSAIAGTALTDDHVSLLKQYHIYDIILCLDGDEAGQTRTAEILDQQLSGHRDLNVKIIIMPPGTDPDSFIRDKGIDAFKKLKQWSAFEWRLEQFPSLESDQEVRSCVNQMINLIVNDPSPVSQEQKIKILAKKTGVTVGALQGELEARQNAEKRLQRQDKQTLAEKMSRDIERHPDDMSNILQRTMEELEEINQVHDSSAISPDAQVARITAMQQAEEAKTEEDRGYTLSQDLYILEQKLRASNWKRDVWISIAAKPNCGKTSLMCQLAYDIASIPENNCIVIYHTIDDTAGQVMPKFVGIADGSKKLVINDIIHPNRDDLLNKKAPDLRLRAYDKVKDLCSDGRLMIIDSNDGASLNYARTAIRSMKRKYPDRNIVYILDNFHKLSDGAHIKDERVRFKENSKRMKNLATHEHICVISTLELNKIPHGQEPTLRDISETGKIEYDCNLILLLHNEVHEHGDRATIFHEFDEGEGMMRMPRIKCRLAKNKVSGFKGEVYMDFFPGSSSFKCVSNDDVKKQQLEAMEAMNQGTPEEATLVQRCRDKLDEMPNAKPGRLFYMVAEELGYPTQQLTQEMKEHVNDVIRKNGGKYAR